LIVELGSGNIDQGTDILVFLLILRKHYNKMSMRKLKFHEQKLLKKVDFLNWKKDGSVRENGVIRRYHI